MAGKEGAGVGMEDAAGFFANVFGGERFRDWVRTLLSQPITQLTNIYFLLGRSERSRL